MKKPFKSFIIYELKNERIQRLVQEKLFKLGFRWHLSLYEDKSKAKEINVERDSFFYMFPYENKTYLTPCNGFTTWATTTTNKIKLEDELKRKKKKYEYIATAEDFLWRFKKDDFIKGRSKISKKSNK